MNLEKLSKPELLTLFSILEGELEARDLVIEALKAQHRDTFIEERYGKYNISDPLMALQRDFETLKEGNHGEKQPVCSNPLSILKVVMKHCKNMQERMLSQLAAAESRHRKVILDLEEERQRHAQDTAEGDDVTYMLEKERERLTQQLEFEKSQVKKFEKEQKKLSSQLEEERARHKQLSSMLVVECKKATAKAAEEGQKTAELSLKLEKEKSKVSKLEEELASKRKRGLQMEAQVEKQLSEFDIEREQLKAKLNREENRTKALKEEVECLKKALKELEASCQEHNPTEPLQPSPSVVSRGVATDGPPVKSVACQTECVQTDRPNPASTSKAVHTTSPSPTTPTHAYAKSNGHYDTDVQTGSELLQTNAPEGQVQKEKPAGAASENTVENGSSPVRTESPVHLMSQLSSGGITLSPSSTAASSLTPSPCSSPVLTKRLVGASASSPGYQSSYQVGINQRFHAARHKFQSQAEQDHQASGLQSPPSRDLSPTLADNSAAKQLARNTVTQVLSRFTSQQGPIKPVSPNSSPFGTDYRNLASAVSPKNESGHSPSPGKVSSPLSPLSPGIKSPTIPRAERGNPPPIPPKKPGLAQSPAAPAPLTKTSSQASSLGAPMDMASSCSNNTVVSNGKDIEILLPTSS
ncbi:CTTNBP2 N-terminal-like protein [Strigops habroptila]|uniref:CTTNBP2 N-terminal like n=1 Tax=Strigops habroptila TaxID=2489341 RepID=A0A672UNF2_STRHB|nr:CTTNBP2 N-terminal-like protein [Strigops habroptila]XP_030329330.1 CTTNBP2 N-terminal-like protein [Strigops habroptila]XP_030329331.1 CTTNBP2 N-terminal-like protein [Strigops habroptila]XP_030329332.1 CTTNBP2 N-terminal-like protein [Strigops habroptila]XP_030329333.1 CTTNBP2 N-terminal-like protein [Strigops habroptila]